MQIRFLGTGGPIGDGGRFQACIFVEHGPMRLLLDCGASSLIPMVRHGIDPGSIDAILISHLHGDHFGGIPYFLLEADIGMSQGGGQHTERTKPLVVAGPPGIEDRVRQASDALFPGLSSRHFSFGPEFVHWSDRQRTTIGSVAVTPFAVPHDPKSSPFGLRLEFSDGVIAYSGDTSWSDVLIELSQNADLFICECMTFERSLAIHLSYRTIAAQRARLACRRLILTHLGPEVLARLDQVEAECAEDGLRVSL